MAGGIIVLSLVLIALPSRQAPAQLQSYDEAQAQLQKQLMEMQAKLEKLQAKLQTEIPKLTETRVQQATARALAARETALAKLQSLRVAGGDDILVDDNNVSVFFDSNGPSWLGVETHEVTADKMKELKLQAERGVVLGRVTPDSPAAKAGLKEKDVITEVDGQRIEGTVQFRRMIREIPAGRTVRFTVWREGHSETINATLGKAEEGDRSFFRVPPGAPGAFAYRMPDVEIPDLPRFDGNVTIFGGGRSRLGIDAEDLSGQLGTYFGVPEGEGVLVREVNSGSPAEKAGLKAGDVIAKFDGERIQSVGDLRHKVAEKTDGKSASIVVLRNKSEVTLNVEFPAPTPKKVRRLTQSSEI
jgi:C-terminal processing protease CtpA/Prc